MHEEDRNLPSDTDLCNQTIDDLIGKPDRWGKACKVLSRLEELCGPGSSQRQRRIGFECRRLARLTQLRKEQIKASICLQKWLGALSEAFVFLHKAYNAETLNDVRDIAGSEERDTTTEHLLQHDGLIALLNLLREVSETTEIASNENNIKERISLLKDAAEILRGSNLLIEDEFGVTRGQAMSAIASHWQIIVEAEINELKNPKNPFLPNQPAEGSAFVGRKRETEAAFRLLAGPTPKSFAVVGAQNVGKTSFLKFLQEPKTFNVWLRDATHYHFIHLEPSQLSTTKPSLGDFIKAISHKLNTTESAGGIGRFFRRSNEQATSEEVVADTNAFLDSLKEILSDREALILFVDHFETLLDSEAVDGHFFDFLKSLAETKGVALSR